MIYVIAGMIRAGYLTPGGELVPGKLTLENNGEYWYDITDAVWNQNPSDANDCTATIQPVNLVAQIITVLSRFPVYYWGVYITNLFEIFMDYGDFSLQDWPNDIDIRSILKYRTIDIGRWNNYVTVYNKIGPHAKDAIFYNIRTYLALGNPENVLYLQWALTGVKSYTEVDLIDDGYLPFDANAFLHPLLFSASLAYDLRITRDWYSSEGTANSSVLLSKNLDFINAVTLDGDFDVFLMSYKSFFDTHFMNYKFMIETAGRLYPIWHPTALQGHTQAKRIICMRAFTLYFDYCNHCLISDLIFLKRLVSTSALTIDDA